MLFKTYHRTYRFKYVLFDQGYWVNWVYNVCTAKPSSLGGAHILHLQKVEVVVIQTNMI